MMSFADTTTAARSRAMIHARPPASAGSMPTFSRSTRVYPWRDLPLWWPPRDDFPGPPGMSIVGRTGFGLISRKHAVTAGLRG